jgi:hypothetical protein
LLVHKRPSKFYIIYNGSNSTAFDALLNYNKIV